MANENIKYFRSEDIKVFPCSFRGNYLIETGDYQNQSYAFDPESRLTTEYNFTHLHSIGNPSSSYVIEFNEDNGILKCVIGGYYFEISNINTYIEDLKNKTLAIQLDEIELKPSETDSRFDESSIDSTRKTYVLKSWDSRTTSLDFLVDGDSEYKFYGLAILSDDSQVIKSLSLSNIFDSNGNFNNETLKPTFRHGSGEHSLRFGENDNASGLYAITQGYYTIASGLYAHAEGSGEVNGADISYTEANGKASHAEGINTKVHADGIGAHVEGYKTKAKGLYSHAEGESDGNLWNTEGQSAHSEGYKTKAKGDYSHAEGESTVAEGEASHTGGLGTKTTKDYATVIGKYNKDVDGEFIVGIGTANNDRDNALVVNGLNTTLKNTLIITNDESGENVNTFVNDPEQTIINTATNTITGEIKNTIKTDDDHYLEIKVEDDNHSTTILDDTITLSSENKAYIMSNKEGILVSHSSTNYDPTEIIDQDTIKITGKNIKLNSKNTAINAINSITLSTCSDAEGTNANTKAEITTSGTKITNSTLTLDGTSRFVIQQNGTTNTKIDIGSNTTTITDGTVSINAANDTNITLNNDGVDITGPITTSSTLTTGGTVTANGDIKFGNNDNDNGQIIYRSVSDELPIITVKKDSDAAIGGRGIILGSKGTTVIASGENGLNPTTDWVDKILYLNSDQAIQVNTNAQTGWADRKTWTFNTDGTLDCPNTIKMSYSGNQAKLISANMSNDTEVAITAGFRSGGEKGSLTLLTNNILTGSNGHISPIYVKQQVRGATKNTITLLDQSGNTTFPGTLSCKGFSTANAGSMSIYLERANEINFAIADPYKAVHFGWEQHGDYQVEEYHFNSGSTSWGNIIAGTFNAMSDARLKENIIKYKPEKSILDLPVYKFDFINGAKNQIGCLAQDLQEICPEIVKEDSDGYLSIQENKLVFLLLEEVKKLKKEVSALKGE